MFRTPIKNSKNVNKPFKSPFNTSVTPNASQNKTNNKNTQGNTTPNTSSSPRTLEAKRILKLDDEENKNKKRKLMDSNEDEIQKDVPDNLKKSDLLLLKRKIFEMRQELDCLKSREQCTKKHDPEDLKISINKWSTACQTALETLNTELSERNGQNSKISDVLKMLNIPEDIVNYSEKEDGFI